MSEKSNRPFTVGFCGRSGSGKSYAAKKVSAMLSAPWIDCDAVYHELLEPEGKNPSACALAIERELGGGFIDPDGRLDRKKLASVVFSDREKLEKLDLITHKFIKDETKRRLYATGAEFALLDAVLLPFSCCKDLCDVMVAVIADESSSLFRILERDKISRCDALKRLSSQPSADKYAAVSDFTLRNSISDTDLDSQCRQLVLAVKGLARKSNLP